MELEEIGKLLVTFEHIDVKEKEVGEGFMTKKMEVRSSTKRFSFVVSEVISNPQTLEFNCPECRQYMKYKLYKNKLQSLRKWAFKLGIGIFIIGAFTFQTLFKAMGADFGSFVWILICLISLSIAGKLMMMDEKETSAPSVKNKEWDESTSETKHEGLFHIKIDSDLTDHALKVLCRDTNSNFVDIQSLDASLIRNKTLDTDKKARSEWEEAKRLTQLQKKVNTQTKDKILEIEQRQVCPNCEETAPLSYITCGYCGIKFIKEDQKKAKRNQIKPLCNKCNIPLLPENKFCVTCGAKV